MSRKESAIILVLHWKEKHQQQEIESMKPQVIIDYKKRYQGAIARVKSGGITITEEDINSSNVSVCDYGPDPHAKSTRVKGIMAKHRLPQDKMLYVYFGRRGCAILGDSEKKIYYANFTCLGQIVISEDTYCQLLECALDHNNQPLRIRM
jgi:hypothetical protein